MQTWHTRNAIYGWKKPRFSKTVLRVLKEIFKVFLYEDRTRKYDPEADEKHPVHSTPYLTKDKSPVSEGEERRVKNEDEIDESHKPQLKYTK